MGSCNVSDEYEWMERVRSGGAVPLLDLEDSSTGWASPPGDSFKVRGPDYFTTKAKAPGGDCLLEPLGFDWIKSSSKLGELLSNPKHRIWRAIENEFPKRGSDGRIHKPFVWAFNLQLPRGQDHYNIVAYFVSLPQPPPLVKKPEGSLIEKFLKGGDRFRNSRLKLIVNIVKGPWVVRKAVGDQSISIIGRALTCKYCKGDDFMEVDIDISSSMVATAMFRLAFGFLEKITVDFAFVIEGQTESELPERVLGAFRFSELDAAFAKPLEPAAAAGSATCLKSTLLKRVIHTADDDDAPES